MQNLCFLVKAKLNSEESRSDGIPCFCCCGLQSVMLRSSFNQWHFAKYPISLKTTCFAAFFWLLEAR